MAENKAKKRRFPLYMTAEQDAQVNQFVDDGYAKSQNDFINKAIDINLREKYIWLKDKIQEAIKIHTDVNNYYIKLKQAKEEKSYKDYNSRFSIYSERFDVKFTTNNIENTKE